ncbi:SDR family oxidoreductase [Spiractinospora alimapuensis]|uniref:SDR family NAD(P)-dependent oxidoreductase n=1 Tax=Spiractinospora alimapuensis TaxID=2820884 RepID=UPI001F18E331|nr:SDR family NAD(P)-dependent oxidoreductase [Spiractinospora alimapuensis]QVQ51526.1 SDR family oxidoreductase [Spiractinospora alimapuensis]
MTGRLEGRIALVTGATRGIGAALTTRFAAEGATVVAADLRERPGDHSRFVQCDVTAPDDLTTAVEFTEAEFGGLDIMVNNAGLGAAADLTELSDEEWSRVIGVCLTGTFHGIRSAAPALTRRGGGAILNLSSLAARRAMPGMGAYSAAKAGVEALTRSAAAELRPVHIRVNAIAPGLIRTAAAESGGEALSRGVGMDLPEFFDRRQGRWGETDEVARAAVHLVSDESSFTSGLVYSIDNSAGVF